MWLKFPGLAVQQLKTRNIGHFRTEARVSMMPTTKLKPSSNDREFYSVWLDGKYGDALFDLQPVS
jgi:hypothetical protein